MPLLLSPPDGFTQLGWRKYALSVLLTWLLPAVVAGFALGVQWTLGTQSWGDGYLILWTLSVLALLSPLLSWFALGLATPLIHVLMQRGWFGWIPALLLGMALGAGLAFFIGNEAIISFGAAQMAILRGFIARFTPV